MRLQNTYACRLCAKIKYVLHYIRFKADKKEDYDLGLVARYGALGSTVFPTFLFYWSVSQATSLNFYQVSRHNEAKPPNSISQACWQP